MEIFREKRELEKLELDDVRDLTPEEIAILHNECLHVILSKYPNEFGKIITSDNLISEADLFSAFLIERLPDAKCSVLNAKVSVEKKLKEYGNNDKNKSLFILSVFSFDSFKKELEKSCFSIRLIEDMCLFHKYILEGEDGIGKASEQWGKMLKTEYNTLDSYAVACMDAIGAASLEFWEEHKMISKVAGSCPPNGLTCNEWQAICDGLGGAIGTIFGGIGGALTGALFSFAVARECVDCDTLQPA